MKKSLKIQENFGQKSSSDFENLLKNSTFLVYKAFPKLY